MEFQEHPAFIVYDGPSIDGCVTGEHLQPHLAQKSGNFFQLSLLIDFNDFIISVLGCISKYVSC
jgi:hypothetical protein